MHRLSLILLLTSCSIGARPVIDAVSPGIVCTRTSDVTLVIEGKRFYATVAAAGTDEPIYRSPVVALTRVSSPTGEADGVEHQVVLGGSDPRVRLIDETRIEIDVGPELGLVAGAYEITVVNPTGDERVHDELFVVTEPPVVTGLTPPDVCLEAGTVAITVEGEGFVEIGGVAPTVTVDGEDVEVLAMGDCGPLVGDADGRLCRELEVEVVGSSFPLGSVRVGVTNPAPASCASTVPASLEVVQPPAVDAIEPPEACVDGGLFTIVGDRFTEGTQVEVAGIEATVTYVNSSTLDVALTPGTPLGLQDILVKVPSGCDAQVEDAINVLSEPDVFYANPSVAYSGIDMVVTVYLSDVATPPVAVTLQEGATGDTWPLDFGWHEDAPGVVRAAVPSGLAPGDYGIAVDFEDGCGGGLDAAITVTDQLTVAVDEVDPPLAWQFDFTPVVVGASDPAPAGKTPFADAPQVFLSPADGGTSGTPLYGVTYRDPSRVTAVIPNTLDAGLYDVVVVNPDGGIGLLEDGLEVTEEAPPVVDYVSPPSLPNSSIGTLTVFGREFRNPTISAECLEDGVTRTVSGTVTSYTFTEVTATLPSTSFNTAICVLTITNESGNYARYSAISIRNPAENLFPWTAAPAMTEARRAPAAAAGRTTSVSRYVYAIGGDDGTTGNAKTSIERAPVGVYGDVGEWSALDRGLPAARTLGDVEVLGRFVYLVGGHDGTTAVDTLWRAMILDPVQVPYLEALSIANAGSVGLSEGLWQYRVAALFDATDDVNPSGESLPSDAIAVRVPTGADVDVRLSWTRVSRAVGYRVYRSPVADAPSGDEGWLTDVVDPELVDDGIGTVDTSVVPLIEGSLGEWAELASMSIERESPCVALAPDPHPDPPIWYLYVAGGRDKDGDPIEKIEYIDIEVRSDGLQEVGAWTESVETLSLGRYQCGGYGIDSRLHSVLPDDSAWVYFLGGLRDGTSTGSSDGGRVGADGVLEEWTAIDQLSPKRAGFGAAAASDFMYVFGGQNGRASKGSVSGELEADLLPDVRNWNSLSTGMSEPRYLMGAAQESAVIFVLGGTTDTRAATDTVDVTNF